LSLADVLLLAVVANADVVLSLLLSNVVADTIGANVAVKVVLLLLAGPDVLPILFVVIEL
jgi:hypothetical protein